MNRDVDQEIKDLVEKESPMMAEFLFGPQRAEMGKLAQGQGWYCGCGHLDASHMWTSAIDDMRKPCNRCGCRNSYDVKHYTEAETTR